MKFKEFAVNLLNQLDEVYSRPNGTKTKCYITKMNLQIYS